MQLKLHGDNPLFGSHLCDQLQQEHTQLKLNFMLTLLSWQTFLLPAILAFICLTPLAAIDCSQFY